MATEGGNRRVSRAGGLVVRPQPISDKSYVESVVSFLHDVVPQVQAVTGSQRTEEKERVLWVNFGKLEINADEGFSRESSCSVMKPLLLVLGYTNGFQMWMIPSIGEAYEVQSLRQGPVRLVEMLQTPSAKGKKDEFAASRPLYAVCDAASPSLPFSNVNLWSLSTGEQVHSVGFTTEVYNVLSNKRLMVVALQEKVAALDACTMNKLFWITSCFPAPSPNLNPLALGERWLAYADCKLVPNHQSCGGMSSDNAQSYTATVINAAKTLTRGLTKFGETVGRWTSSYPHEMMNDYTTHKGKVVMPGVVTIVDIPKIGAGEFCVQEDDHDGNGIVAHFPAHAGQPVSAMAFDPSGSLLVTADVLGHNFHVFHIMAHPICPSLGAVHHLYTLHRGDTTATVYNISFSFDSRWIAISTLRGTTHLFAINPYGGSVNVRTHMTTRVVNRSSRFHTSAGLDDMEIHTAVTTGRSSPGNTQNSTGSPSGSPHNTTFIARDNIAVPGAGNNCLMNARLPPLPHPYVMYPLAQIRTPTGVRCGGTCCGGPASGISKCNGKMPTDSLGVVALFAPSRGWLGGSANSSRSEAQRQPVVDPLFILDLHGNLTEYTLEPQGLKTASHAHETPLELLATSRAQWSLARSPAWQENKGPLQPNHPLLEARPSNKTSDVNKEERLPTTIEEANTTLSRMENPRVKKERDDEWLTNIEMETHAGPHRRLWMGPQFSFKTFQPPGSSPSGSSLSLNDPKYATGATITPHREGHPSDFYTEELDLQSLRLQPVKSDPVPTPGGEPEKNYFTGYGSPTSGSFPLIIDNGPGSYSEPWPTMTNGSVEDKDDQLVETLLDAMNDNATMPIKTDKKRATSLYGSNGDQLEFHSDSPGGSVNAFASYNSSDISPIFPPNGSPEWS